MKAILALVLVVTAVGGGASLGWFLRPAAKPVEEPAAGVKAEAAAPVAEDDAEPPVPSYVKISRQMIVPVVEGGSTRALMVFEIALDVPSEHREMVFEREPRIRDAFLRELFELSYTGAFLETYTSDRVMEEMRSKLLAAAKLHLGGRVTDVLILDALRQEL